MDAEFEGEAVDVAEESSIEGGGDVHPAGFERDVEG